MQYRSFFNAQAFVETLFPKKTTNTGTTGLKRIQELLLRLGNPERAIPCIHVGGTAGKGSTSTMIAAILQASGYKTGLHLSPHLEDIRERMQINQTLMPEARFVEYVAQIGPIVEQMTATPVGTPSYFEVLLAISFLYFRDEKVDIAVIEVGVGGTFDGTNVIQPLVAVLTNVSLDHTDILGDTVEKIAADKVGIFKPKIPVVTGVTQPSVIDIVTAKALATQSPVYRLGTTMHYKIQSQTLDHSRFTFRNHDQTIANIDLLLIGEHQIQNACLAIQAVLLLPGDRYRITVQNIKDALFHARFAGRFERVGDKPMIILDGAHNPAKMAALVKTLKFQIPDSRFQFVFAAKKGKNITEMLDLLRPIAKKFYFTRFETTTDFGKHMGEDLSGIAVKGVPSTWIPSAIDAYTMAAKESQLDDIISVTGSLYLVGEIRTFITQQSKLYK